MGSSIENVRAESADPLSYTPETPVTVGKVSELDSDKGRQVHGKLMGSYQYEKNRQAANRYQMSVDADYYDSIQLTDEDIAELVERGQAPLVYNLVKRTADWVIGTEKRTRIDFKVLGRDKTQQEVEAARTKSDVLKYLSDVNKTPFHRSQAFREMVISGLSWLEDGVRGDPDDTPIYSRKESWRNILHDSHGVEMDGTDMMYIHRHKYTDVEVAVAMFPDRERFIHAASTGSIEAEDEERDQYYLGNRISGQDYLIGNVARYQTTNGFTNFLDNSRERVKLIESWFRRPVRDQVMVAKQLPMFHGQRYNPQNDDMRSAILMGDATITDRVRMAVFYAISTEGHLLALGRSPYRHNQFPFTPMWCYRRGRDNAPYGIIRPIRDPQDGFNRRMSKSIFALSAYRVTMDSDAIDPKVMSYEDVRREAGRPDALIVKRAGKTIEVAQDRGLAEGHMKLAQYEAGLIIDSSGVTADNLGMESNAQSGKAIIAKQSEGSSVTAEIFDNLRFANQIQGEKQLSLSEQYMTEEQVIRITDAKGRPTWKKVNEIVQNPDGSVRVLNDITATKSDFVIDQQDFSTSMRDAASQQLFDFAAKYGNIDPKVALSIIDMALDLSNLPDKDDLLKRIREITGFKPPEDAVTPEEQAQQQAAQQQQQAQQAAQLEQQQKAAEADIGVKLADAELKRAQAEQALAQAEKDRNELSKGAHVLTPEEQKRWDEITAAHGQATQALAESQQQVQALTQQQKDRQAEIVATKDAAMHKANQERAAAEHAATVTADATRHVANRQFPQGALHPQTQETLADVMQAVEELRLGLADLEKKETEEAKADQQGREKLLKELESMISRAVQAAQPKAESAAPAAPVEHHVHLGPVHIDASKSSGPKVITLPGGGKATMEDAPPLKPPTKPKK